MEPLIKIKNNYFFLFCLDLDLKKKLNLYQQIVNKANEANKLLAILTDFSETFGLELFLS
jgi:hypothetical protein